MVIHAGNDRKTIKEINEFIKFNSVNPLGTIHKKDISVQDLIDLKKTKDYINNLYYLLIKPLKELI